MMQLLFTFLTIIFVGELSSTFVSPTERYMQKFPAEHILFAMEKNGISIAEAPLFGELITKEKDGFIGYHGGCSSYRLFQDLIRLIVEETLQIPVRPDFHFLRVPDDPQFDRFNTARDFIDSIGPDFNDSHYSHSCHLISLNISLFQSHDNDLELTPRYYIHNKSWTTPDYWTNIRSFVEKSGLDWDSFEKVIKEGLALLPQDRGILMQFFDQTNYHLLDKHFYLSQQGGVPYTNLPPSHYLQNPEIKFFPQLRLVVNNNTILNPSSPLIMHRYDALTDGQKEHYEKTLRKSIRELKINDSRRTEMKEKLLSCWHLSRSCDRISEQP